MRISLNQKFNDAIKKDMRKEDENGRLYYNFSSHSPSGKPHKMVAVGEYVDFYDPKTGDKLYGKVLSYYTNGMVDIQVDGKKYKVRGYAPSMITLTEGIMDFSTFLSESSPACHEVLEESSKQFVYRIVNSKGIRSDAYKMSIDSLPNFVNQLTHNAKSKEVEDLKAHLTDYFLGRQFSEKLPFGRNAPKSGESTKRKHWDKVNITFQTVNSHEDSARLKFVMSFIRHPNGEAAPFRDSETGDIVLVEAL